MDSVKIEGLKPLQMRLISEFGSDKYCEAVSEFWSKNINVVDMQFSTSIDEEGSILYSGQFTFREL